MTLSLSATVRAALETHALGAVPEECCGILLGRVERGRRVVRHVRIATNVSRGDRRRSYEIDPRTLFEVLRHAAHRRTRVLGFYHSHPDGSLVPSDADRRMAWPGKSYVIIGTRDRRLTGMRSWRARADGAPLIEEPIV